MNNGITAIVRPQTLDEVVGMDTNKRIIRYLIQGSKNRNEPVPSWIISGSSGCGKSTLADIIGREIGGTVHKFMGSDFKDVEDLYKLAVDCKDNSVVFIEEAESLGGSKKGRIVQFYLYSWIEDFNLPGSQAFGITKVPKVSFVFATTSPGRLLPALRNRCRSLSVSYYGIDDLCKIIVQAAAKMGHDFTTDEDALALLAQSSRGMPRIAVMDRLSALLNVMSVDNLPFNIDTVEHFLAIMDIHPYGLEPNDIQYCQTLYDIMKQNEGRPVSLKTIGQTTGLAEDLVVEVIEAYLLQAGLIKITSKGRSLTPKAYEILKWSPIATSAIEESHYKQLDKVNLAEILNDSASREIGVQGIMGCFNLRYSNTNDRASFYAALDELGYTVRRGRGGGIVKKT